MPQQNPVKITDTMPELSVAPMIDWTNTHFRVLMRMLAPQALLYTEMQSTGAIRHNPERALYFTEREQPLALQVGGSDIHDLVHAACLAEEAGFAEINLNLGCPSPRVIAGSFGACLMREGTHVATCINAMKAAVTIPVTAKTRIGVDHDDSYEFFAEFAKNLIDAGCDKLIIHARKAWLSGLNPKQNRTIPAINYDYVYRLKAEISKEIPVIINGNIKTIDEINQHLHYVDGIMLGRLACQNPYALAEIHQHLFPEIKMLVREEIIQNYLAYAAGIKNISRNVLLKPLLNMVHGQENARAAKQQMYDYLATVVENP